MSIPIPIVAKDIAILRLAVISDGHLAFSHEIMNETNWKLFFSQFFWVSKISGKNTIIKNVHEKVTCIYLQCNCIYYILCMLILTHLWLA